MTLSLQDLPSTEVRPQTSSKSQVRLDIIRSAFSRRSMFRAVGVLSVSLGLTTLQSVPGARPAMAAPSTWWWCRDYSGHPTYSEPWKWCNPNGSVDGYVGTSFCVPGGKYHRTDSRVRDGVRYEYFRRFSSCADKNAWRWLRNEGPNTGPRNVFCSDGRFVARRGGRVIFRHPSVCRRHDRKKFNF
ncbi:hypothetical protein [Serinicoccus kebangsaanensis]|uniref:hypothetical protein n=1 Tax=Serinicoccus kebangsaanensis TaxID=2602069 RepID=UPI00124EA1CE|nr:hypothetical protein [Serinicoccus kebangsaanensis]